MFILSVSPRVSEFDPDPYIKLWLKNHGSAEDSRRRVIKPSFDRHCKCLEFAFIGDNNMLVQLNLVSFFILSLSEASVDSNLVMFSNHKAQLFDTISSCDI